MSTIGSTVPQPQFASNRISATELQYLADYGFVVVKDFLSPALQAALREDVDNLRSGGKFKVAKIGHDGMVQDASTPFRDVRISETCFLNRHANDDENTANVDYDENKDLTTKEQDMDNVSSTTTTTDNAARQHLYKTLSCLKTDLGIPLLRYGRCTKDVTELDDDLEELMYAYYPKGGYYRRHVDADDETVSSIRQYSFLLYLNDADWDETVHGGQLRLHRDRGRDRLPAGELPNFTDVPPRGGTLVVFRSNLVPHEVLDTRRERLAIVGWFLSKSPTLTPGKSLPDVLKMVKEKENVTPTITFSTQQPIHPGTLEQLRKLREQSPRLRNKLEPTQQQSSNQKTQMSGLLGDDFYFPSIETVPTATTATSTLTAPPTQDDKTLSEEKPNDTLTTYWKPIATFSVDGRVSTLSLGSQRLRKVDLSVLQSLIEHANTVDLGNSDLSLDSLISLLSSATAVQRLYLSGYGLRNDGVKRLLAVPSLHKQLETLDLRYNDVAASGAAALSVFLRESCPSCRVLHLEGNQLQDDGVAALQVGPNLRELYLGQNRIGPVGARVLAANLYALQKLHLEGNRIGPEGAEYFIEALEKAQRETSPDRVVLEKLYVDNNGIGKDGSVRLGKALNSATIIGIGAFFQDGDE